MKQFQVSWYHPEGGGLPEGPMVKAMCGSDGVSEGPEAASAPVLPGGLHHSGTATVVRLEDAESLTSTTDRNLTDEFEEGIRSDPLNPTDRKERS